MKFNYAKHQVYGFMKKEPYGFRCPLCSKVITPLLKHSETTACECGACLCVFGNLLEVQNTSPDALMIENESLRKQIQEPKDKVYVKLIILVHQSDTSE